MIFSRFERMNGHTGTETRTGALLGHSSGEYWTMEETLIQQYYVSDEDLSKFVVKLFRRGR